MFETYYDSAEGITISPARARKEVEKHGAEWVEFLQDVGEKEYYDAQEVLNWLGY